MTNQSTHIFQENLSALVENLSQENVSGWLVEDCLDLMAGTVLGIDGGDPRDLDISLHELKALESREPALRAMNSPRAEHLFDIIMQAFEPRLAENNLSEAIAVLAHPERAPIQSIMEAQETVVEAWDYDGLRDASDDELDVILNYNGARLTSFTHMLMELLPIPAGWETDTYLFQPAS